MNITNIIILKIINKRVKQYTKKFLLKLKTRKLIRIQLKVENIWKTLVFSLKFTYMLKMSRIVYQYNVICFYNISYRNKDIFVKLSFVYFAKLNYSKMFKNIKRIT